MELGSPNPLTLPRTHTYTHTHIPPSALACLSACFLWRIHFQQLLALLLQRMTTACLCGQSARDRPALLAAIVLLGAVDCCWLCPFAELATSQSLSLIGHIERVKTPSRGQGEIKGHSTGRVNKAMLQKPCCCQTVPQCRWTGVTISILLWNKQRPTVHMLKYPGK